MIAQVQGVPVEAETAWHLTATVIAELRKHDQAHGRQRSWPTREDVAASYARARGRVSSTELGSLVGASPSNVGGVLKSLEERGALVPSRANRRGKGFFYRYAGGQE